MCNGFLIIRNADKKGDSFGIAAELNRIIDLKKKKKKTCVPIGIDSSRSEIGSRQLGGDVFTSYPDIGTQMLCPSSNKLAQKQSKQSDRPTLSRIWSPTCQRRGRTARSDNLNRWRFLCFHQCCCCGYYVLLLLLIY